MEDIDNLYPFRLQNHPWTMGTFLILCVSEASKCENGSPFCCPSSCIFSW